jgi:hypothetical protein
MLNKFHVPGLQFLWFVAAAAGFGQMASSSKMLGKSLPYYTMQRLNPKDYNLILRCCENTNSHTIIANSS